MRKKLMKQSPLILTTKPRSFALGLRWKMLFLVLLTLLPPFILTNYSTAQLRVAKIKEIRRENAFIANSVATNISQIVESSRYLLLSLSASPEVKSLDPVASSAMFSEILKGLPSYSNIAAITPNGDIFASAIPFSGSVNVSDRNYFQEVIKTHQLVIGDFTVGRISATSIIVLAYPVFNNNNQLIAVVVCTLNLSALDALLEQLGSKGEGVVTLIDRNHVVIARYPDPEGQWIGQSFAELDLANSIKENNSGVTEKAGLDGVERIYSFEPVPLTSDSLHVVYGISKDAVFRIIEEDYRDGLRLFALICLIAFLVVVYIGKIAKKSEDDLIKSRDSLSKIIRISPLAIVVYDLKGIVSLWNPAAEALFGWKEDEVLGKLIPFIKSDKQKAFKDSLRNVTTENNSIDIKDEVVRKDGSLVSVSFSASANYDKKDNSIQIMNIILDISKDKQIEKLKKEFVAITSHQLRTPLTGIKWSSELLLNSKNGKLNKKQLSFIEEIVSSNSRMINLIDDLLTVSRIESDSGYEVNKVKCDVVAIIIDVINDATSDLLNRDISIELDESCPKKLEIEIDKVKIFEVFENIINNSIKYSFKGSKIKIGVKCQNKQIEFSIKDIGYGIPTHQKDRVFQRFFRGDNIVKISTEGTGLGLYIAKGIVEAHRGKIWFESEENKGTTFYFTLPM